MSCYFQANSRRQKASEDTASMYCFLMFDDKMKEDHRQAIEENDATIALLNDDLKNREYENVGLQEEIRAKDQQIVDLQKRYLGYLSDEDKSNGISIIAKNNDEAEYPYISISGQHGYRRHKVRLLLTRNKGSTLFADGDTPNAIVTYNFWRDHRLIVVEPNRPRHFRLDTINQEQLLTLNDTGIPRRHPGIKFFMTLMRS